MRSEELLSLEVVGRFSTFLKELSTNISNKEDCSEIIKYILYSYGKNSSDDLSLFFYFFHTFIFKGNPSEDLRSKYKELSEKIEDKRVCYFAILTLIKFYFFEDKDCAWNSLEEMVGIIEGLKAEFYYKKMNESNCNSKDKSLFIDMLEILECIKLGFVKKYNFSL